MNRANETIVRFATCVLAVAMICVPTSLRAADTGRLARVRQADGTIDRAEVAGGTACVMLGSSDHKADAWTFMKWWVSADTQAEYGRGVEMALGEAARYTPANQEALERLGWTAAESAKLREQWDSVVDLPEVPGGYYIARNLDNAFRACVYKYSNPREMLNYWTYETNKEIARKRREFHLDG